MSDELTKFWLHGLATKQAADNAATDGGGDVLFVGDMTETEMAALLQQVFERAFAELAGQIQQVTKQLAESVQAGAAYMPQPQAAERLTVTTKSKGGGVTFKA